MPNIGPLEIGIVLVIALLVFGPRKLPELGKSVGSGIREFRHSVTGSSGEQENSKTEAIDAGETEAESIR
jgi:sec-independent protein translocase protein TatA